MKLYKWYSGIVLGLAAFSQLSNAQQITGTDILNLLIENEVLTAEQASEMISAVRSRSQDSSQEVADQSGLSADDVLELLHTNQLISQESYDQFALKMARRAEADQAEHASTLEAESVRIPYIPNYMQQEMEQKLKFAVESDIVRTVHEDVVATARSEGWGIKEAPSWVHKVKFNGDGRVRYQGDFFGDNHPYALPDVEGQNSGSDSLRDQYNNAVDDRHRLRSRFRLMMKAKPFETVELGMRLTTGDAGNPVSSNQTLGNYGAKWDTNFDLGYIHYKAMEKDIELIGGRFKSPMLKTDLIFDNDMTFEGVSGTYYFLRNDTIYQDDHQWDPYISVGIYPIQEINQFVLREILTNAETGETIAGPEANVDFDNNDDKFLYALQLGTGYSFYNRNELQMALSWYHYENISGKSNPVFEGDLQDVTVSPFYQFGNSLYNIANNIGGAPTLALASDFSLVNATVKYRMANFFPTYLDLHADIVQNIAFDQQEVASRQPSGDAPDGDMGYQFGVSVGTMDVRYLRDWRLGIIYRHLEGDAVLDAFADSDFALGGTDAEGMIFHASYGVLDNVIAGLRYISAERIDSDEVASAFEFSSDTLFLDLNARF